KPKEQKGENSVRRRRTARRKSRRTRDLPRRAIIAVRLLRKHNETCKRRQILRRRFKRNAKNNFIVVPRLKRGMANDRFLLRQRKKIERRIFHQSFAGNFQAKIGSNPAPIGTRYVRSR